MGFRYQKRIKLGKGFGLNLSKSGISSSLRTKKGTIGTKGFSVRTGIPGLTFRKTFSKSSGGCLGFFLLLLTFSISIFTLIK
ncbi:DUF4236 domain-containing protein [Polaribacter sp. Hel1_85]|uniref:DUF4236 domain-containing protein n=1 Tax=Polaribacter sp. Hel1_85 TaxID=1250005 RepID=UPI000567993A|nr:DUF4236 domain-containing protein [Polaribacter sp. Hel1_85]